MSCPSEENFKSDHEWKYVTAWEESPNKVLTVLERCVKCGLYRKAKAVNVAFDINTSGDPKCFV